MRNNDREKANFTLKSSIALAIFSTGLFLVSIIYIGLKQPFPYWWVLIIVVAMQIIVTAFYCWYTITKIDIFGEYLSDSAMKIFLIIIFIWLICLQIFAFIYGLYTFNRIFLKTKHL